MPRSTLTSSNFFSASSSGAKRALRRSFSDPSGELIRSSEEVRPPRLSQEFPVFKPSISGRPYRKQLLERMISKTSEDMGMSRVNFLSREMPDLVDAVSDSVAHIWANKSLRGVLSRHQFAANATPWMNESVDEVFQSFVDQYLIEDHVTSYKVRYGEGYSAAYKELTDALEPGGSIEEWRRQVSEFEREQSQLAAGITGESLIPQEREANMISDLSRNLDYMRMTPNAKARILRGMPDRLKAAAESERFVLKETMKNRAVSSVFSPSEVFKEERLEMEAIEGVRLKPRPETRMERKREALCSKVGGFSGSIRLVEQNRKRKLEAKPDFSPETKRRRLDEAMVPTRGWQQPPALAPLPKTAQSIVREILAPAADSAPNAPNTAQVLEEALNMEMLQAPPGAWATGVGQEGATTQASMRQQRSSNSGEARATLKARRRATLEALIGEEVMQPVREVENMVSMEKMFSKLDRSREQMMFDQEQAMLSQKRSMVENWVSGNKVEGPFTP